MSHDTSHAIAANPTTARARVALNWSRLCDRLESRASASVLALIARFGIAAVFWTSGRTKVEAKDEMKRRGLRSPDRADALCPGGVAQRGGWEGISRGVD